MGKLFKSALILLIAALVFAILLLAYSTQNSTTRVGVKHTENIQGEAGATRILSGKSIIQ